VDPFAYSTDPFAKVTVRTKVAVDVPLITPVEVLNERPEGSGELMLHQ
jgi:hypothetical protein